MNEISLYNRDASDLTTITSLLDAGESSLGHSIFFYISDIHLDWKIEKEREKNPSFPWRGLVDKIVNQIKRSLVDYISAESGRCRTRQILIGGDISSDYEQLDYFFQKYSEPMSIGSRGAEWYFASSTIFVLGNHELWSLEDKRSCDEMIEQARTLCDKYGITLLQNALLLYGREINYRRLWELTYLSNEQKRKAPREYAKPTILTEEQILAMPKKKLQEIAASYGEAILGGIGFSGKNKKYNAQSGIYRNTIISQEEDIRQSRAFEAVYEKVLDCLGASNVICFTHNPMSDWSDKPCQPNWVYVHGHTHKNIVCHDPEKTVIADNQIGYKEKNCAVKYFLRKFTNNPFRLHEDGMYEISKTDYLDFYWAAAGNPVSLKWNGLKSFHMFKKNNTYMFFAKKKNGDYYILSGGRILNTTQSLKHYYNNMDLYIDALTYGLKPFQDTLKQISKHVKGFGGSGTIHGCIVDIDFFNHIYLNPHDGKATPYYATDMVNKTVYPDIQTLLRRRLPDLYERYRLVSHDEPKKGTISKRGVKVTDTSIYKDSRKMFNFSIATEQRIVRDWDENIVEKYKQQLSDLQGFQIEEQKFPTT